VLLFLHSYDKMAVLGVQLVFSMIMASVMSKFSAHFSFGRWLLCGGQLARYIHPSDEELRRLAGSSSSAGVGGRNKNGKRYDRRRDLHFNCKW
jgi:hypothetical protein